MLFPPPTGKCCAARRHRWPIALIAAMALSAAPAALADICKYLDKEGNVIYSNVPPEKGLKRLSCEGESSPSSASSPKRTGPVEGVTARTTSPGSFPRIDANTQKGRDDVRRKVLLEELSIEEKLLAEVRTAYAEGAPVPLPDERANADKYRERINKLRQMVSVHQKNVDALKKEIAGIR
jgi:hypothetical protein